MLLTVAVTGAACVACYLHRAALKADVAKAEAKLGVLEAALKADLRAKLGGIVSDIAAWESSAKAGSASVIAQFEARIRQIL